jgi:hypothetical protein
MSVEGLNRVAQIFTLMQQARIDLLGGDKQDVYLGQLLLTGKDAMKERFAEITLIKDTQNEGGGG